MSRAMIGLSGVCFALAVAFALTAAASESFCAFGVALIFACVAILST